MSRFAIAIAAASAVLGVPATYTAVKSYTQDSTYVGYHTGGESAPWTPTVMNPGPQYYLAPSYNKSDWASPSMYRPYVMHVKPKKKKVVHATPPKTVYPQVNRAPKSDARPNIHTDE